jgi:hypothetical protein
MLGIFFFLMAATMGKPAVAEPSENTLYDVLFNQDRRNLVVIQTKTNDYGDKIGLQAIEILCDELRLTGFNFRLRDSFDADTTRESPSRSEQKGLFGDFRIAASIQFEIINEAEGMVTLYENNLNYGAKRLEVVPISLPLSRDEAEQVALKISEKLSIVADSAEIIKEDNVKRKKENSIERKKLISIDIHSNVVEEHKWLRWGVHLTAKGEYSPGGTGTFGALSLGLRWFPRIDNFLELSITYFGVGRDVIMKGASSSIDFGIIKLKGAHEFRLHRYLRASLGVAVGVGYIRAEGKSDRVDLESATVQEFFPYGGVTGELIFVPNDRVWIPVRVDLGGAFPGITIRFADHQVAKIGMPLVEFGVGVMVRFG